VALSKVPFWNLHRRWKADNTNGMGRHGEKQIALWVAKDAETHTSRVENLATSISHSFSLNIRRVHLQALGPWLGTKEPSLGWYINVAILRLYNWDGNSWTFYIQIPQKTRGLQFTSQATMTQTPPNWWEWEQNHGIMNTSDNQEWNHRWRQSEENSY